MTSVLQDWVMELPLREQGTMLTAIRGCDVEPKEWANGEVVETPARQLTAWIRFCVMNAADPRELGYAGGFLRPTPPDGSFRASALGHLPHHWYAHVMHAVEVIAYRHPDLVVRERAGFFYLALVDNLHLRCETADTMFDRLSEDRIASGVVVS